MPPPPPAPWQAEQPFCRNSVRPSWIASAFPVYGFNFCGLAGSSAATELARAGLSVLGLEGKVMPRYKVCGGALSARTDRLLEPDYHSVVEETIHRVRFQFAGAEAFEISSPEPMAYMVMRDRFDAYLCGKAREAGASPVHIRIS